VTRAAAIAAIAVGLTACSHTGGGSSTPAAVAFRPGAFEPSLRVVGPLPGHPVRVPAVPRAVVASTVREIVHAGSGDERLPLYVARDRTRHLCIGTTGSWQCLRPVDAQPVFAFTLQGGHGPIRDHGAVVGLAAPDVRVTVERAGGETRLPLRRFRGFPWRAFASPLWQKRAPDTLNVYDRRGRSLSGFLGLASSANLCAGRHRDCAPRGAWRVIGDPWGDASDAQRRVVERAKRIAFADRLVRGLLVGRRYGFDPPTAWSKCRGGTIGAVLNVVVPPATFSEDWPSADYDAKSHSAYVQRITRYRVSNVTQLQVSVDTNRGQVVGIDPTVAAGINGPDPKVNLLTYRRIGKAAPGGGPDSGDCSSHGD